MLRLIFIGQLLLFICLWLIFIITANADLAIVASASTPPALVALFLVGRRDLDLFSPLVLVFAMAFIGSFMKAVYFVYFDQELIGSEFSLAALSVEILHVGALALSIAMLALLLGYTMGEVLLQSGTNKLFRNEIKFGSKKALYFTIATIFLSLFYSADFMSQTGFSEAYQDGVLSAKRTHEDSVGVAPRGASLAWVKILAQTLPQTLMFIFLANILRNNTFNLFNTAILLALVVCSSVVPIIQSARLELVYTILISIVIFHYAHKRISTTNVAILGVALIVGVTALGQLRNRDIEYNPDAGLSIQKIMDATLAKPYFMGIGKTAVIVEKVPAEIEYLKGESLAYFLIAPIPRTIWPEKPVVRIGLFVGQSIYERGNQSGVPPGFPAELYLNFGYAGILLGMLIVGFGYAALYILTIKRRNSPVSIVVYSVGTILFSFTLLTGDLTIFVSQTFRYGLMLLLIIWLMRERQQNTHQYDCKIA